jgi:hypothetical protein
MVVHKPHTTQALCTDNACMQTGSELHSNAHTPQHHRHDADTYHETYDVARQGKRAHTVGGYPEQQRWPCLLSLQANRMCFTRSEPGLNSPCPNACAYCSTGQTITAYGDMDRRCNKVLHRPLQNQGVLHLRVYRQPIEGSERLPCRGTISTTAAA